MYKYNVLVQLDYNKVSLFTSGVTSEDSAVLGLRKFGACSAVSVGRLTLVEGGLVWRLVAGTWAFVVTLLHRLGRLTRKYTLNDTVANVRSVKNVKKESSKL